MHSYTMTHELAHGRQGERLRQAEHNALIASCLHGSEKPGAIATFRRTSGEALVILGVWLRGKPSVASAAEELRPVPHLRIAD